MRILAVTNMYPTPEVPHLGVFIEQQIKGLRQIGLEVDTAFVDRHSRGMRAYIGLGHRIAARCAATQPDLVHVMYGGIMADRITRAVKERPTVVTFHGSDLLGEHLSGLLRELIAGYGVRASWKAARRADGLVVVSRALRDALPRDISPSKVRIIPCGIDMERFMPLEQIECRKKLGWDAHQLHIVFPSNMGDPVKRPGLARASVEALSRLGTRAEIHFLAGIPNQDVPVWLNAADALLLTSLHEGSPTVVKEALACNVPVVSVDVGDVRERIQGIKGCYLASPDPVDLAAKLQLVYAGPRRILSRHRIEELSVERTAMRLNEFYGDVLEFFAQTRSGVGRTC
jgi:teichuronic acid biosynthesis glycosyltransferase TuaC